MNLKLFFVCVLSGIILSSATPLCDLKAKFTKSDFTIRQSSSSDLNLTIRAKAKNTGTCGWERGKAKLEWVLKSGPKSAKKFDREILSGKTDLSATVLPGKIGEFKPIELIWPEVNGKYTFEFYITYNNETISEDDVDIDVNWGK